MKPKSSMDFAAEGTDNVNIDTIIIGAGLSGLSTAHYLKQHKIEPLILEARSTIGGRIKTNNSIDLGGTWLGSEHYHLQELLDELNISIFPQYQTGKGIFIHSAAEPPHYFNTDENSSSTFRINGGSGRLIDTLARKAQPTIELEQVVEKICDKGDFIKVVTNKCQYRADKVVVTVPPQLVSETIGFNPSLPESLTNAMQSTHTWMSNAIKVGLTFKSPFWREQNLSGTLIAPNGPVIELYDHSNRQGSVLSLMGFANEALREHPPEKRKRMIVEFLVTHFGEDVNNYLTYREKDWLSDSFTAGSLSKSIYMHPDYGNPVWEKRYMNGKLLFSGSETSSAFGGYMEGAVAAGKRAAEFLA